MAGRPYEEQIKYWAAKRYEIPRHLIESVNLEVDVTVYRGCPTCGPEKEIEIDVSIRLNQKYKGRYHYSGTINYYYGQLNLLLEEIINA